MKPSLQNSLSDYFFLQNSNSYIKLIENFLNSKISADDFCQKFFQMRANDIRKINQLIKELESKENLEISFQSSKIVALENASGFSNLIDRIAQDCDLFVSNEVLTEINEVRADGEIDEIEFRRRIQKALLKIQTKWISHPSLENRKIKSVKPYQDDEVLKFVMQFFTILTFFTYSILSPIVFSLIN